MMRLPYLTMALLAAATVSADEGVTLNGKDDGYRGIWYFNQKSGDEYVYKYSGGLGTYCAKHQPFAVYCPEVQKTFFCYGGATKDDNRRLLHMVSYYDHQTGQVPRPTVLLDKQTDDAHDNPVLSVDGDGYLWIFSTSHGRSRPSYIHRSRRPYDVSAFERIEATRLLHNSPLPRFGGEGPGVRGPGASQISERVRNSVSEGNRVSSNAGEPLGPPHPGPLPPQSRGERGKETAATRRDGDTERPITNFSYMQAWHVPGQGFVAFFTRYDDPAKRTNLFMSSPDGVHWSEWQRLAAIEWGHYQISAANGEKAAAAFNFHPTGKGLNWRTNLYYMETADLGRTWRTAAGRPLAVPLADADNAALVHDYRAEGLNVYLKDIGLDRDGRPVILFLTSPGYESGPQNDPRTWRTARWTGATWEIHPVTTSDNNYDTGSLYLEADGTWRIIAPTEPGPQPYNPGGEMAMWVSRDRGRTWKRTKQLTANSPFNHTYARRPVNAHPDFYALWADGHGRQPSPSRLFFCDRDGHVFRLPSQMEGEFAEPIPVPPYEVRRDDRIRFFPAPGAERLMTGGVFEGTNFDPHQGPYFSIHTIEETPQAGWNEAQVDLRDYRWLRYRAPGSSFGTVAEIEFVRDGRTLSGTVFGRPAGDEGHPADYGPAFDGDPATVFRHREGSNIHFGIATRAK